MKAQGAVFKVALAAGKHIGFAYGIPIEQSSWGPLGQSLMVLPCLYVVESATSQGAGKALLTAIEQDALTARFHGTVVTGYRDAQGAEWFMPASFFQPLGYAPVDIQGRAVLLWKPFSPKAVPPHFLQPHFVFKPMDGVVVVDLFWNAFCLTSVIEAERVREVCSEFSDRVVLREYQAEDRDVLLQHQVARGIYIDGKEVGWGFEAPKDGLREAIARALRANDT